MTSPFVRKTPGANIAAFVRSSASRTTPTGNQLHSVPPLEQEEEEEEEDASYPGVSKHDRDVAFGRANPADHFGLNPFNNYSPPGEF